MFMSKESVPYRALCTEYYELDKPTAPKDALDCYLHYAKEADGPILEPMCGTGRFLIPLLEHGYTVTGFDYSPYMLDMCRRKCEERGLITNLQEATFETFSLTELYNLIFIPSGSFGHLITSEQVNLALTFIAGRLKPGGKFVVEIETLKAIREPQDVWRGRWVTRSDGSKIVINILSRFDPMTHVETGLFRYELWEENLISRTEVEDYHVRHYEPAEIEKLLEQHNLKIIDKWQAEPHSRIEASEDDEVILYECVKN
jgi:SAM-dependent methyltransferase